MRRRGFLLLALAAGFFSLTSSGVQAKRLRFRFGSGIARGAGRKEYGPGVLSVEDLKQCLLLQASLESSAQRTELAKNEIEYEQEKLTRLQSELEFKRISLNRYSQSDVDQFNEDISAFEQFRNEFNKLVEAYNQSNDLANVRVDDFNFKCANKRYYEDDLIAAKQQ